MPGPDGLPSGYHMGTLPVSTLCLCLITPVFNGLRVAILFRAKSARGTSLY